MMIALAAEPCVIYIMINKITVSTFPRTMIRLDSVQKRCKHPLTNQHPPTQRFAALLSTETNKQWGGEDTGNVSLAGILGTRDGRY